MRIELTNNRHANTRVQDGHYIAVVENPTEGDKAIIGWYVKYCYQESRLLSDKEFTEMYTKQHGYQAWCWD